MITSRKTIFSCIFWVALSTLVRLPRGVVANYYAARGVAIEGEAEQVAKAADAYLVTLVSGTNQQLASYAAPCLRKPVRPPTSGQRRVAMSALTSSGIACQTKPAWPPRLLHAVNATSSLKKIDV